MFVPLTFWRLRPGSKRALDFNCHPGVIDIDMSSSLRSLQSMSDVDSSSHLVRYSTMHEAVQDSVLHVAEREGSSSVRERIDCADPVQPRFRRVEHAFGCLGRYHRMLGSIPRS